MSCIFCKIIQKDIPAHVIYEDEATIAFLDISPVNPGHALVVPKTHYENLEAIPEEALCVLIKAVKMVGGRLKERLGISAYNIEVNNGSTAGQIVPHLHFHVIPRHEGDGKVEWPHNGYGEGEIEKMAEKLK